MSDAGSSLPVASGWFVYYGPERLSAGMVALISAGVVCGAFGVVCGVGCVYRRRIAMSYHPV